MLLCSLIIEFIIQVPAVALIDSGTSGGPVWNQGVFAYPVQLQPSSGRGLREEEVIMLTVIWSHDSSKARDWFHPSIVFFNWMNMFIVAALANLNIQDQLERGKGELGTICSEGRTIHGVDQVEAKRHGEGCRVGVKAWKGSRTWLQWWAQLFPF